MSNFVLTPNAVAKLRRAIAPRSGNTGAVAATGVPLDPDKFPPPFTVRWSASADSGAGAWVIWLPDVAQLVMLKDAHLTPTGVTAEQALPTGWYTIDDATASSTEVYLNVTIPETGTPSAEISTTQGQSTTGETVMSILVAEVETDAQTGAKRVKQYVDSAVLVGSVKDGESGADAGIIITQDPVLPSTDHPGGGIKITFQPTQDGQPHGQPTVVTLWNGSGGGGGGTDLSDTPALDVVPSTGNASAGIAVTASRSDHVHKMPATVVLTDSAQTITGQKTFGKSVPVVYQNGKAEIRNGSVHIAHPSGVAFISFYANGMDSAATAQIVEVAPGVISLTSPNHARISTNPTFDTTDPNYSGLQIMSVASAEARYQRRRSASREYVEKFRYNTNVTPPTLEQRIMVEAVDGTITPKSGTGYTDGWTAVTETIGISSILPQSES